MTRPERIIVGLLSLFLEPWLLRYACLAAVGLPCVLVGVALRLGWLVLVGAVLGAPFALWAVVFLGVVMPVFVGWLVVSGLRGRSVLRPPESPEVVPREAPGAPGR